MAGEMIASAVVKEVVRKLGTGIWDRLKLSWDFKQDLEEMKMTLSTLQAVLQDAEKQSIRDGAVCLWLKELKAAAYDIEDMLNDFPAEDPNQEVEVSDDMPKKVRRCFSVSNPLISRDYMARKMKKMRKRLDKIAARRSKFHLKEESASNMQDEIRKRESCSAIDESMVVYGRDEEKEIIMNLLLDAKGDENVSVIPIVGIGGLGKTTLAKLAFNDERVGVFDLKIWVYISIEFDLKKIGKAIISGGGEDCNLDNLESISGRVRKILARKRYLLVLDDMWSRKEDDWESLKPLLYGAKKGSKIIVTTRNLEVALMMASIRPLFLQSLCEDDSWELFKRRAFRSSGEEEDATLEQIGKEIVGKCGGVPLVINAIGSMMRTKRGKKIWSDVRDSEIWELEKDDHKFPSEDKILSSLKLSYYHMPFYLKPCFAYCSLFPRGYEIDKDKLIQQWIGEGLIQTADWSLSLEVGDDYVNHLFSMSFFQDKKEYEKMKMVTYKMHGLVYDLAQSVAGDEVLILNPGERIRGTKWCRYVTLTGEVEPPKGQAALLERVRALHFRSCRFMEPCHNIFLWAKYLRVLDLSGRRIVIDQLPSSIYELKQLRYLDISFLGIQILRESIGDLQNLQVLNLSYCSLKQIPESIGSLQKLRILNLVGCCNLQKLSASIGNLKNLNTLNLQGCSRLRTLPETIGSLKSLHTLNLQGCYGLQTLPTFIGSLKNLHTLSLLDCFGFQTLPETIGSLKNLQTLDLEDCDLQKLPASFGTLKNLRTLNLQGFSGRRTLPEFIGCLENLFILNLSGSIFSILPESIGNLQNLLRLNLSRCHEIKILPKSIGCLRNLTELNLSKCDKLQILPESIGNVENLQYLKLSRCRELQMLPESIGCLRNLLELNLLMCDELRMLPEAVGCLEKLRTLDLSFCPFMSLPRSISNLQNLRRLDFSSLHAEPLIIPEVQGSADGEISVGVPPLGSFRKITLPGTRSRPGFTLFKWVRMHHGGSLSDTTEDFHEGLRLLTVEDFHEGLRLVTVEHFSQVSLSDVIEEFSGCDALVLNL